MLPPESSEFDGFDWDAFDNWSLTDSEDKPSCNDDAFDAAEDDCLRGPPVLSPPEPSSGCSPQKASYGAYVVFDGRLTGVFQTWPAMNAQVKGFRGNTFKGYNTLNEAEAAWEHACASGVVQAPEDSAHVAISTSPNIRRTRGMANDRNPSSHSHSATRSLSPSSESTLSFTTMGGTSSQQAAIGLAAPSGAVTPTLDPLPSTVLAGDTLPRFTSYNPVPRRLLPPQPLPSTSRRFQAMPKGPLNNEEAWWVVIEGEFPGAFLGRTAANKAAGKLGPVVLKKVGSHTQATAAFTAALMDGKVVQHSLAG